MVADTRIQVLVVGGGLSGLTTASVLHSVGIDPVVIERDEGVAGTNGVAQLWPGAVTLLRDLGLDDQVVDSGAVVDTWTLRRPDGTVRKRHEAESFGFVAIRYSKLCEFLRETLPDETVQLGRTLQSIERKNEQVSVTFANGVREPFDIVIGADGVESRTRALLGGDTPRVSGTSTTTFPLPSWSSPTESAESWTDDGIVFRVIPVGETAVGCLTTPATESRSPSETVRTLRDTDIAWHPVGTADSIRRASVETTRDIYLPTTLWGEGQVALVGDAAHAWHRLAGAGSTLAIEDAFALTSALTGATDPEQFPLDDYATRRASRLDRLRQPMESSLVDDTSPLPDSYPSVTDLRSTQITACFGDSDRRTVSEDLPDEAVR